MPSLDWIGKQAVVTHHREVPTRLLEPDAGLSCGSGAESGNLIVQGDNLHALKALLPRYAGQVKCVYIDPPYNTGNEGWVYNDNVNSPEINKWLGETVGKEAEDLCRHDKWLCMMYPRLVLLKQFLREDGAIFISIDDNEVAQLRLLMDEIFGKNLFVCNFAWEKRYAAPPDTKGIGYLHESIMCFAKSKFHRNMLPFTEDQLGRYKNPDNDPRGPWKAADYTCRYTKSERPNLYYPIIQPNTGEVIYPKVTRVWAMSEETHTQNVENNLVWWGSKGTNSVPALKNFQSKIQEGSMPVSLLKYDVVGHTDEAAKELRALVPEVKFTPKPTRLIMHLLKIASDKDSLILDSFAGSGTTGHAVLKQNAADGGTRRFILVEMEEGIAKNITAERIRRVTEGYTDAKGKVVEGLGGGFQFCRLSEHSLFDEWGEIRESVRFAELAEFVWLCETGAGFTGAAAGPLLGIHRGRAIYLLYNGILKDRTDVGGNVLNSRTLEVLPPVPPGTERVVYGTRCRFAPEKLEELGMEFKQLPYQLRVRT